MKRPKSKTEFPKESDLVRTFLDLLQESQSPFGDVDFGLEFDYRSGRADVIAKNESGEVLAFEAKLRDWRYASHQAYRNTCFAHRSYILVPLKTAEIAIQFGGEFAKRGVGICALSEDGLKIILEARNSDPLMPWLSEKAGTYAARNEVAKCNERPSSKKLPKIGARPLVANF